MSSRILLVEDEPGLRLTVSDLLASEGHAVETAADGPTGLLKGVNRELDLIILDVMLPGKNGYDVLKELRKQGCDTAILMLTAKGRVMDRVVGLKLGADDYLAKPFDPTELLARVEALLRRVTKKGRVGVARFEFNSVEADFESGLVRKNGEPVSLAAKELQLLRYLIDRRGVVVTREDLLRHVWEYQSDVSSRTIDVHVAWLRQKLEDNPQSPKYIQTVRGVGYRFST
jgi:two-component system, OmpR family, alkaline phosphatase synthesis response regulator PhoP